MGRIKVISYLGRTRVGRPYASGTFPDSRGCRCNRLSMFIEIVRYSWNDMPIVKSKGDFALAIFFLEL